MPYRRIYHRITFTRRANARVSEAAFSRFVQRLRHMVQAFNRYHRTKFSVQDAPDGGGDADPGAVLLGPLALTDGGQAACIRLARVARRSPFMQRLHETAVSARAAIARARRQLAHRRLQELEDRHRDLLAHDFGRVSTTLLFVRNRRLERLLVRAALCLMAECLGGAQMDFVEDGTDGATHMLEVRRARGTGSLHAELQRCGYARTGAECEVRENGHACLWNAARAQCRERRSGTTPRVDRNRTEESRSERRTSRRLQKQGLRTVRRR